MTQAERVPPRLRRLAAAAGVPPKVFLQNALNSGISYEDTAFELGVATRTLQTWREIFGRLERGGSMTPAVKRPS